MIKVHLFLSIILFDSPIRSLLDSRWLDFICFENKFEYYNNKLEISMSLGQKTLILLTTITIIVVAHPLASATCPNPPPTPPFITDTFRYKLEALYLCRMGSTVYAITTHYLLPSKTDLELQSLSDHFKQPSPKISSSQSAPPNPILYQLSASWSAHSGSTQPGVSSQWISSPKISRAMKPTLSVSTQLP